MSKNQQSLLQLYRQLLRSCQTFPSRKRESIHQAIREEFRANQNETNAAKIQQYTSTAVKGLDQLQQFTVTRMTTSTTSSSTWNVHLEQNPMPKPADYDEKKKLKLKHNNENTSRRVKETSER